MRAAKGKKAEVVRLEPAGRIEGARVARVVSARGAEVSVEVEGVRRGSVVARVSAALDDAALARAARERQEALVVFEDGDPSRPVVVALLRSRTPLIDAALAGPLPAGEKTARVDGRRVEIEGREEVVLRCGKASITLRRDGKVVVRGVNVVTQADAVQKIRGGKVEIN
jgi:uncharacterized protein involved in type VI secretion and phage assembly